MDIPPDWRDALPLDRPWVIKQGVLRHIYKHFFGPLVQYKPDHLSIEQWMMYLFDSENRTILRFVATGPFWLPGLYYEVLPSIKVQGIGHRDVAPKQELYARFDARMPDVIDVEYSGGGKEQVFCLSRREWDSIAGYLKHEKKEIWYRTQSGRQPD